jgi:hypothetical protein
LILLFVLKEDLPFPIELKQKIKMSGGFAIIMNGINKPNIYYSNEKD